MTFQKVLVIGSGGREHTLAWSLARSPQVGRVYLAPGNAGTVWEATDGLAETSNVPITVDDFPGLIAFARDENIDLTVVGPEVPLVAGIADEFTAAGLLVFGPSKAAAQLEGSKAFANDFMKKHGIPSADYRTFTEFEEAQKYLEEASRPVVIKASGLAAGKGVIVLDSLDELRQALRQIMQDRIFGEAGDTVVIEERLSGPEVSLLAFSDGKTVVPMLPARDHKRANDNDEGPNTGGMGCYTPVPDVSAADIEHITKTILQPTVDGMRKQGTPYSGVLYAGLMKTADGFKIIEFNCRFGDPETQVILPLLESDLFEIAKACAEGRLDEVDIRWNDGGCATVVLASPGYPGSYPKGLPISGLDKAAQHEGVTVFHAGTAFDGSGQLVTNGGRVLNVSAEGSDLPEALRRAYSAIDDIHFDGMHFRRDIGKNYA
ncbi:MAG: phosphoribosylamine--glycine ligase [Anaerolineae bacterium]|nr:phosphoribosylamine--glycine ligase [Anaerolineae bacterium]